VNLASLSALAVLVAGCARISAPPGGPLDRAPPVLLSTRPDSLEALPGFKGDVEFVFDEVVAEGGTPNFGLGTGDLERLVILSPSQQVPAVRWKRSRITVHPREGWRPNTVYRVELLPGLADLSNNRSKNGRIITFTTGAPLPTTVLSGRVVDWGTQRPPPRALVEAVLLPDSTGYRTATDSAGRFRLGPLPAGEYLVYGVLDQNNDLRRQPREAFDTVRVAAGRDSVGEIWAFKRDSSAIRITNAESTDSLSIVLTFSQQLNPYQRLPGDSLEVRLLPDSVPVPVLAILTREQYDTAFPARRADTTKAKVDSAKVRADSLRADSIARAQAAAEIRLPGAQRRRIVQPDTAGTGPLRTKPPLYDKLYVRVAARLAPGTKYALALHGVQNVSRVPSLPRAVVQTPTSKPPADSTKAKADSAKAKP
jgi:hypothetical protein